MMYTSTSYLIAYTDDISAFIVADTEAEIQLTVNVLMNDCRLCKSVDTNTECNCSYLYLHFLKIEIDRHTDGRVL